MAIQSTYDAFNPQVNVPSPGGVPNFKPAGDNLSFKSPLGEALKGFGELVGTVTQGVDAIIKSNITGDVEKEVDPQRKQQLSDLEATYGTQAVTQLLRPGEQTAGTRAGAPMEPTQTIGGPQFPAPEYSESMTPGGLVAGDQKLPKDINDLPGKINSLYNARNDGHVSDTYYWGRLSDIASDIRSRYPRGYRNYIDNKIQEITGRDPANAYIESLIRDINTNLGDKNKARDKLIEQFYQGTLIGRPGVPQMIQGLTNGTKTFEEGTNFLGSIQRDDDKLATSLKRYQEAKARREGVADEAAHYASTAAPLIVNNFFRGIKAVSGTGMPNIATPEDMYKLAGEYKSGERQLNAQVGLSLATSVSAWYDAASKAIDEDFQKNGVYKDMANDPDKIQKIKDLHLLPLKQLQEAFYKGDMSVVAHVTARNDAAHTDFANKMLNDKDVSYNVLALDFWRKTLGDQGAAALITREPMVGVLNTFSQKGKAVASQLMTPDEVGKQLGGKDYKSLVDGIEAIRTSARDNGYGVDHPQVKKTYQQLFKDIEDTLVGKDIKPETKAAMFKSIFTPDNFHVLREIASDKRDPYNPNVVIPGYQSLFYRLTKSDIAATAKELGPEYTRMYLNWVQTASRTDLFGRDVVRLGEQLDQIKNTPESELYRIDWNTATKNFDLKVNPNSRGDPMSGKLTLARNTMPGIQDTIASMNKGLTSMANVAKGLGFEGTDIDGFALDQLVQAGVPGLDKVGQMPSKITDAIRNAYAKERFAAEQAKTRRQIQEQKYLSPKE